MSLLWGPKDQFGRSKGKHASNIITHMFMFRVWGGGAKGVHVLRLLPLGIETRCRAKVVFVSFLRCLPIIIEARVPQEAPGVEVCTPPPPPLFWPF